MKILFPSTFLPPVLLLALAFTLTPAVDAQVASRPNVLFIAIDDLRPELGCYGSAFIQTPNIDRLARTGVVFDRHYVQYAICIPSRVALLTSLSPERTHQNYAPTVWNKVKGAQPWGTTFHRQGYETVALGKIWHVLGGEVLDTFDLLRPSCGGKVYGDPQNQRLFEEWEAARTKTPRPPDGQEIASKSPIAEAYDAPDSTYVDGATADEAIAQLDRLKGGAKPFMLAVGFHKPHAPFVAPKRYWDLYDRAALPLPANPHYPAGMPEVAWSGNSNFHNISYGSHRALPKGDWRAQTMPPESARWIRHGYFAAVSFVDAQVGRVLDALEKNGLAGNTVVVLWGDHGFHLGDLNMWGKMTNFEEAVRSPLIIRAPGRMVAGSHSPALVESVDILPTLVELCGLESLPVSDGTSFAPLLANPKQKGKTAAHHVFIRRAVPPSAAGDKQAKPELVVGHAIRTADHRLIDWRVGWSLSGERVAVEIYDYAKDPFETKNVAADPAYADTRRRLEALLRSGPARMNP